MGQGLTVAAIQARMGSQRLPGKAMRPILGRTMVEVIYERLGRVPLLDKVVLALADTPENRPLQELAEQTGMPYFAGSERDLVSRLLGTARVFGADVLVRVTGDCPLIDPQVVDRTIAFYRAHATDYDYVSNALAEATFPDGLDTAVIPTATLERLDREVHDPQEREWFPLFIKKNPERYRLGILKNNKDLSGCRWTIDYEEDMVFVRAVFETLYPQKKDFGMEDVLALLDQQPQLARINAMHAVRPDVRLKAKEDGK